jgi:2-polyprenyl-3-methyl-5-hydroxy-6-metoxy-1,4-benzoquinol methylase
MGDDELTRERALVRAGWELVDLLGRLEMEPARRLLRSRWAAERARAAERLAPLKTGEKVGEWELKQFLGASVQTRYLRTLDLVEPGERVFEIGPGRGYLAGLLLRDGKVGAYRGIDIDERNLASTREIFELNGVAERGEVEICDLRELSQRDVAEFETDLLVCCEVIEHLPEPERAVTILADALPPGTDLLISVPLLGRAEHVWGHVSFFSAARVRDLVEGAGLTVHAVDVVDNIWVFVLASHDTGPSERAARAAAKTTAALAGLPTDGEAPRSIRSIGLAKLDLKPSASRGLARLDLSLDGKRVLCELTARRRRRADGESFGGLRLPANAAQGLRLQLDLEDIKHVTAFYVDAYAGRKRVARWTWNPASGQPAKQPPTFVIRPGAADGFFQPLTRGTVESVDAFDVYAAVKSGSSARFAVRRAAVFT